MSIHFGINPILFTYGSTEVRWYGLMMALAILTVIVWTYYGARKSGIPNDVVLYGALWAIPLGLVFSRLVGVVDRLHYYADNPSEIFGFSGLAIYGGILGAMLGVWIYCRIRGQNFWQMADIMAPGIILGQAVGRVGCTINGCCYGSPTDLPWGFTYTNSNSFAPLGVSTHPVVVYELLFDLAVFGMLLIVRKRMRAEGSLFLLYLATYSVGRFLLSYLRENKTYGGLVEAQIIAIIVLAITIPLLVYKIQQRKPSSVPLKTNGDK